LHNTLPRVLAIVPSFYPSTVVGVVKPLQRLHQQGGIHLDITLQYFATHRAIAAADVVVMCGEALPPTRRILQSIAELQRPFVFELDDNRLEIPSDIPGLDYARDPAQRALIIECLRLADVVRVYSTSLRDLVQPYNANVVVVDGPLDWSAITPRPLLTGPRPVRVVYATSRLQDRIGLMVIDPLLKVLDRFPDVEVTVWGATLDRLAHHPRVRHKRLVRNYDRFLRQFNNQHFDVGLAPLPNDLFHRCKSNNKFREYAACGIAGIYSDTPVYSTSVVNGATGLLVPDDSTAWFEAMAVLIEDDTGRRQIGDRAQAYAREHYNDAVTGTAWLTIFSEVTSRPITRTASLPFKPLVTASQAGNGGSGLVAKLVRGLASGPRATVRRCFDYGSSIAQILSWRLRRNAVPAHAR
jgi:glycosyltransferase involved in cell wall biosynthesis